MNQPPFFSRLNGKGEWGVGVGGRKNGLAKPDRFLFSIGMLSCGHNEQ